jgi:hypothetical protein
LTRTEPRAGPDRGRVSEGPALISVLRSPYLLLGLVLVGIGLRVAQYAANRSLWIDEVDLSLNLIARSFIGLTKPLQFGSVAPIGFLFSQEGVTKLFGFSEYALRLFPLVAGIAALAAFAWLARDVLPRAAAPFALVLFAAADGLIYYSSEAKPYSGDVAIAVGLIIIARRLANERHVTVGNVVLSLLALFLVTVSFSALFVVAGIATALAVGAIARRPIARGRAATFAVVLVWLVAAAGVDAIAARRVDQVRPAHGHDRFFGIGGSSSIAHALNVFGSNITDSIGFLAHPPLNQIAKLALLCVLVGMVSLARREPTLVAVLLLPAGLAFVASAVHYYPLYERTELFLVPSVTLLLAQGVAQLVQWTPRRWTMPVAGVLVVLLALGPGYLAVKRLVHPRAREEIRPVLAFIRDHWRPGDTLYVHYAAQYAFRYYSECGCLRLERNGRTLWPVRPIGGADQFAPAIRSESSDLIVGGHFAHASEYITDLKRLEGRPRVWFLYSHFSDASEESFIQHVLIGPLNRMGVRIAGIDRPRAHAYLYKLRSS